jgi:hypothetical protein
MENKAVDGIHLNRLLFEGIKCNKCNLTTIIRHIIHLQNQVVWP